MYAQRQLTELEERKALLRARIALRRVETVISAGELARPLAVVDRGLALWRQVSPLVKAVGVPLSLFGLRQLLSGSRRPAAASGEGKGWMAALVGALPIILQVYRSFSSPPARPPATPPL